MLLKSVTNSYQTLDDQLLIMYTYMKLNNLTGCTLGKIIFALQKLMADNKQFCNHTLPFWHEWRRCKMQNMRPDKAKNIKHVKRLHVKRLHVQRLQTVQHVENNILYQYGRNWGLLHQNQTPQCYQSNTGLTSQKDRQCFTASHSANWSLSVCNACRDCSLHCLPAVW